LHQFTVAALAVTLSGGLHAAGFIGLTPQTDVTLQGGTADSLPTLGDSFADMAQGAAFAAPPPQTVKPQTATLEATAKAIPAVKQTAPVPPVQATPAPMAQAIPALNTSQIAALSPVTPPETLPPAPETASAAPDQSLRPHPRPDPAPQGNADRNATRGTTTGQDTAKAATAQAPARQATTQGDGGAAASASYGRAVLTQISRTRKARAPSRGRTVVAFSISDAGSLASVQVLHSSGSPDLDRVAMDHIRRAAPFPKPPSGAQRQFSFEFVGRS
jgi:protein TonB